MLFNCQRDRKGDTQFAITCTCMTRLVGKHTEYMEECGTQRSTQRSKPHSESTWKWAYGRGTRDIDEIDKEEGRTTKYARKWLVNLLIEQTTHVIH